MSTHTRSMQGPKMAQSVRKGPCTESGCVDDGDIGMAACIQIQRHNSHTTAWEMMVFLRKRFCGANTSPNIVLCHKDKSQMTCHFGHQC